MGWNYCTGWKCRTWGKWEEWRRELRKSYWCWQEHVHGNCTWTWYRNPYLRWYILDWAPFFFGRLHALTCIFLLPFGLRLVPDIFSGQSSTFKGTINVWTREGNKCNLYKSSWRIVLYLLQYDVIVLVNNNFLKTLSLGLGQEIFFGGLMNILRSSNYSNISKLDLKIIY